MYSNAEYLKNQGIHVVSTDEKTGIQALEREAITGMTPKQPERQDPNYIRHGTQCLIANKDIATGKIIAYSVLETRTEKDFLQHIKNTVSEHPDDQWIFVVDQLNTHKSESLCRFIAEYCDIQDDLGIKGKTGILANMETRKEFLEDASHKIRFFYTPKHSSWLNQIEAWFSILVRRLLKRLSVTSKEELKDKLEKFIEYYNSTMAKPAKWLYRVKGRNAI